MNLSNTIWPKISFVVILYSSLFPSNLYGCRHIHSSELVCSSGKLNVHPKSDLCLISYQEVSPPFGGTTVYVYPGKEACLPIRRRLFSAPKKGEGCVYPWPRPAPHWSNRRPSRWGHTHIHQPSQSNMIIRTNWLPWQVRLERNQRQSQLKKVLIFF